MRSIDSARINKRMRFFARGTFLIAVTVVPLINSTAVGAARAQAKEATPYVTLAARTARACGPLTFDWHAGQTVTYFQIHASGVSCAVAKSVVAKGGKWHGVPPAGWSFVGTQVQNDGAVCATTWKHGSARVTGYLAGC